MSPTQRAVIVVIPIVAIAAAIIVIALAAGGQSVNNNTFAANNSKAGSLTIVTVVDGSLAGGAIYQIFPNPFTGASNFTLQDGSDDDTNRISGILTITGLPDSSFVVIQQKAPEGQSRDAIPKTVTVSNQSSAAISFVSADDAPNKSDDFHEIEKIVYSAKFECGTIRGSEGPLRPGHYDTDIGIFNKQEFPVRMTWSAVTNDGISTNAMLKTLQSTASTSIVCKDLSMALAAGEDVDFMEGFVIIEIPLDVRLLGSVSGGGSVIIDRSNDSDRIDILDVQVFYTANALDELPHEILMDKILFVIQNDTSGKIPQSIIGKLLDVTVPSNVSGISNPEDKVKQVLSQQYSLTEQELSSLKIEVRSVGIGVGTMIDDHAISLSRVRPQASG